MIDYAAYNWFLDLKLQVDKKMEEIQVLYEELEQIQHICRMGETSYNTGCKTAQHVALGGNEYD